MSQRQTSQRYKTFGGSRAVRHPQVDYAAGLDIHVIIAARAGRPFEDVELARQVCRAVEVVCGQLEYRLYGYCLMPDHLHALLSPGASGVELRTWLQRFKSFTAHWAKRYRGADGLWQRSCYDHVCREGETAEGVLRYIANNPVRNGLVENWKTWPWTRVFVEI